MLDEVIIDKKVNTFVIPYRPRDHFKALHSSPKRFRYVVAHRRAGKSVAEINEIIKRAFENTREYPPPRYAYIGPSFAQAKDLIWNYLKHYLSPFGNQVTFSESDLQATLPNGAMINLYGGSAAYERMRGLYFDGAVADEFSMLHPDMWGTVVRPCLADYRGWFIASGTSNGDDHFHALKIRAEARPESWEVFIIPVDQTDALDPEELKELVEDMTPEQYAREMLCSFDSPIEGAYYADLMNDAQGAAPTRITSVPHQPEVSCWTEWDLGISETDPMHINIMQQAGGEIHQIDEIHVTGKGFPQVVQMLTGVVSGSEHRKNYIYKGHLLPHDIAAKELGTGKSREEILGNMLGHDKIHKVALHNVADGITAVRATIPRTWFDKKRCPETIKALRNYQRGKNGKPLHNWASHPADAKRTGAVGMHMIVGWGSGGNIVSMTGRLKRRIRGVR